MSAGPFIDIVGHCGFGCCADATAQQIIANVRTSGLRNMLLIYTRRQIASVLAFQKQLQQFFGFFDDVFDSDAVIANDVFSGSGGAEAVDAKGITFITDIFGPAE